MRTLPTTVRTKVRPSVSRTQPRDPWAWQLRTFDLRAQRKLQLTHKVTRAARVIAQALVREQYLAKTVVAWRVVARLVVMELEAYLSLMEGVGAGVEDVHSVRTKSVWIRAIAGHEGHPVQICAAHGGE